MKSGRLNLGLQTKLSQKLLITPQMKQSLSILQMPVTELVQELNTFVEENPMLDELELKGETEEEAENSKSEEEVLDDIQKVDWEEYFRDSEETYYTPSDEEGFDYEKFVGERSNLFDHLMFQLTIHSLPPLDARIGEHIIGNLSEDGYFRVPLEDVAAEFETDVEHIRNVLAIIQSFDPPGIASRTLGECISTQLVDTGIDTVYIDLVVELFENHENDLLNFRYEEIRKAMSIEEDTFNYLLDIIRTCDPKPGLNFESGGNFTVIPDVYIVKSGTEFDIRLNEDGMPSLRLNTYYLKLLKKHALDKDAKEFLEEKLKNAIWLIKSLNKRQKAIYRVVKAIVEVQGEFLRGGAKFLKPLRLKDIADVTELHESTVSRVTAGKYAMTEQGIIELKSFFVKGIDSEDGDLSTQRVKMFIKGIVDEEPGESPFSDQKIVEILEKKGIKIARRTVAKYRDEMNIPTKSQRKRIRR